MMTGTPFLPDLPGVNVGMPVTDNILGSWAQGKLGYSIGPEMMFEAPSLNPWVNMAF